MATHGCQHLFGVRPRRDREHLALVGHVKRVETEQLAYTADGFVDGDRPLV
jgi:hypothetical protein